MYESVLVLLNELEDKVNYLLMKEIKENDDHINFIPKDKLNKEIDYIISNLQQNPLIFPKQLIKFSKILLYSELYE